MSYLNNMFNGMDNEDKRTKKYGKDEPIDWNADQFYSFIKDNMVDRDNLDPKISSMLGLPSKGAISYLRKNGSGLDDYYYSVYENEVGAFYDIWDYVQNQNL